MRILIIIIGLTIMSCGSDKSTEKGQNTSQVNETAKLGKVCALVFCDLTSSIDSNLIKDVAIKANKLLYKFPQGSKVEAYPVDDNTYSNPIFSCEIPTQESNLDIDKMKFKEHLKGLSSKFAYAIYDKYKQVNSTKSTQQASCIIGTLETAYNYFKDKNGYRYELIYFSDMIEQCSNSQAGSIYICGDKYIPNKSKIIKQIDEKYKPNFNLKSLIGNNVSMVITTSLIGDTKCLRSDEQREVWSKIFNKVGYTDEDFKTFHFRQGLPDRLVDIKN
jgi:hypothetical protein